MDTPCSDPANDPNDWFIERDGKQYRDDEVLTQSEKQAIYDHLFDTNLPDDEFVSAVDAALDAAAAEKIRLNLIRRRKARDVCYECPMRLACLDARLEQRVEYGTWGGYYPEELRKIEDLREEHLRRQGAVD